MMNRAYADFGVRAAKKRSFFEMDVEVVGTKGIEKLELFRGRLCAGIVGSRRRQDMDNVQRLVDSLDKTTVIVSGGCQGVDSWAVMRAKERGMDTVVFRPETMGNKLAYFDVVKCYYDRNKRIAELSNIIYAFVSENRKGGTENTIKHANKLNKSVVIK
jgi:predicted Rossmann fold nucleotide-binding protein DprA/Smf involved in DNA uptake